MHRALKGVTHYLALKTLISLWTGLIVWLGLLAMGVQFALMWGVLAFLLNYVPNNWLRHLRYPPHAAGAAVQRQSMSACW
ncbi:PerM family permease [Klebsiella pneumoniae]|uniref:PerM family permease n=1 Tax=Klebsiella pneumoniae TaxID=573 RepID=A0A377ZZM6_KLEPN|nr:PerM family permease [Klebsiella pneumoniae]